MSRRVTARPSTGLTHALPPKDDEICVPPRPRVTFEENAAVTLNWQSRPTGADVVTRAVAALFPNDPPRFFERTPFGYFDVAEIRRELQSAGFGGIEIESVEKVTRAPSAAHVAFGLCKGTPLRAEIEARAPTGLDEITAVATDALATCFGSGAFDNRMRAQVVTAYRA